MDRTGATPPAQALKACKMTSRCPQQPALEAEVQAPFEVAAKEPPQPSSYIQ